VFDVEREEHDPLEATEAERACGERHLLAARREQRGDEALARVVWRIAKARRVASILGGSPRVRVQLSVKLWLASFVATSTIYLVQMDVEGAIGGRWPLFAPWLHTSALPVFAVLAVFVAVLFRGVELWLHEYERLAAGTVAFVRRLFVERTPLVHTLVVSTPRSRFGLAFESRPPPLLPA